MGGLAVLTHLVHGESEKNGSSHEETRPWAVFPLFRPLFPAFYGPTPPHMRPLRAVGCENGGQGEGNPPGSGGVLIAI